jgi:hypothetical protein
MALLHIDHAINIPDKPAELEITSAEWEKFMRSVWLRWWKSYYHQYQEEIDASLNDFTIRVFTAAQKRADAAASVPAADTVLPSSTSNVADPEDDTDDSITTT